MFSSYLYCLFSTLFAVCFMLFTWYRDLSGLKFSYLQLTFPHCYKIFLLFRCPSFPCVPYALAAPSIHHPLSLQVLPGLRQSPIIFFNYHLIHWITITKAISFRQSYLSLPQLFCFSTALPHCPSLFVSLL